jgi:membrane protein
LPSGFCSGLWANDGNASARDFQHSDLGSSWGTAAASLIGVLVWMYYSSLIVLFGAELTQVWASEHGYGIRPDEGAVER